MSDLYNMLIDELEKNDIFVRYSTIEPKIILDLSGHDKPFKFKIRELKESYQKNTREIWALEKEMDIILNTLDLKLQNNKVAVLKENKKVVGLDFSEHDKVFEDKIAELKKDYKTASELLCKYQQENEALKRRIQELDTIDAMRIDEKRELKQRIAELESKETEKQTKINLNDRIKVKLTPLGAEIYYHMFDDTNKKAKKTIIEPQLPKVDEKGYTEFTLWGFINTYGQYIEVGKPNIIDPIDIIACE